MNFVRREGLFDLMSALVAEAILYADLCAAAFAACAKLTAAEGAIQIIRSLCCTAGGTNCPAVLIDLIDDQSNDIGKQSDETPV